MALLKNTFSVGGWVAGEIRIKANLGQSWSWSWGWARQYMKLILIISVQNQTELCEHIEESNFKCWSTHHAGCELAVPAWHSGLTMKESAATERVQKVAVSILIDHNTRFTEYSFEMALVILNIDPLEVRKYYVKSLSSRHLNLDMLIYLKPIKISIKKYRKAEYVQRRV